MISEKVKVQLREYQRSEITEYHIYRRLASMQKSPKNRLVLEQIAEDEKRHYEEWKEYTGEDIKPDWGKVRKYFWISSIFGITFGTKLMEREESNAQEEYNSLPPEIEKAETIASEEQKHESALLAMLDEERMR